MSKSFVRRDSVRFSKIGKNRPKLQKWRKPKGRDSKMRLKRKSYPKVVSVGYKSPKSDSGKIDGKTPVLISNLATLSKLGKDALVVLSGKLGARKKMEIIKEAETKGIKILNLRSKK